MNPIIILCGKTKVGKDTVGQIISEFTGAQCFALADPIKRFLMRAYSLSESQMWGAEKETQILPLQPAPKVLRAALEMAVPGTDEEDLDELEPHLVEWSNSLGAFTTPRKMLQTFGTECIREVAPDFWIDHGLFIANVLLRETGVMYERTLGLVEISDRRKKGPAPAVVITDGRFRNEILDVAEVNGARVRIRRPEVESDGGAERHVSETELDSMPNAWFTNLVMNDGSLDDLDFKILQMCRGWSFETSGRKLRGAK